MRRSLLLLALILVSVGAFAQSPGVVFEKPFKPMSPVVVGQGGSFTANGSGWDAFFTNPAALAGANSFTLVSANPWIYTTGDMADFLLKQAGVDLGSRAKSVTGEIPGRAVTVVNVPDGVQLPAGVTPDTLATVVDGVLAEAGIDYSGPITIPASWADIEAKLTTLSPDSPAFQQLMDDFLALNPEVVRAASGGLPLSPKLRIGTEAGIGLIVKGFGIGAAAIVDASIGGTTVLTTSGDVTATVGAMGGYAFELKLSDSIRLRVGGLIRPMFRVRAPIGRAQLQGALASGVSIDSMTALLSSADAFYGTAMGIDVGAILGVGPFNVGLAATDLFDTKFAYKSSKLMDLYDQVLATQGFPTVGTNVPGNILHVIPMDVRIGASFHPDLGGFSFLIDPTISIEIGNFLRLAREAVAVRNAGGKLVVNLGDIAAFGAEVRLLRFLKVRAGYYQGAFSAGIGAKILFLDLNVAAVVAPKIQPTSLSGVTALGVRDLGDVGLAAEVALRF